METAIQTIKISQIVQVSDIEKIYKEAKIVADKAMALAVRDYPSSDQATLLAKRVTAGRKAVDELRKKILAESKQFTDTVNAMFKPILEMCNEAKTHLNNQRDAFARAEDAKLKAEQAKADAEVARRQKISLAKGGNGESVKPVEQPTDTYKHRSTDTVRRIPDRELIQRAIDKSTEKMKISCLLEIPGLLIYPVWKFDIIDPAAVPDEYRKNSFVDGGSRKSV